MSKLLKRVLSLVVALVLVLGLFPVTSLAATEEVVFDFGDNGDAAHVDGNDLGTSASYTSGNYTLDLTAMSKVYGPAYDATGNSCIKMGTSSVVGTFTFAVPEDVTTVIISAAKYKAKTTTLDVNGTQYSITTSSNDGAYTDIEIDTSSTKTVTVATVSGKTRAMINSITYVVEAGACEHTPAGEGVVTAPDCTSAGYTTYTCASCGEEYTADVVEALGHSYDEGVVTDPTCIHSGYTVYTCGVCGNVNKTDYVDATGHTYVDGVCSVCATSEPVAATAVEPGVAYKWFVEQGNLEKVLYFAGTTANKDYYLSTTEDQAAATDVYVEETDGGYYIYFMDGETKTYIELYLNGTYQNLKLTTEPTNPYTFNTEYNTMVASVEGTDCYIGAYNTYSTMSCSKLSYAATSFPSHFYHVHSYEAVVTAPTCTEAGYTTYTCACGDTYTGNEVAALGHTYVDGACSVCGEADPDAGNDSDVNLKTVTLASAVTTTTASTDGEDVTAYTTLDSEIFTVVTHQNGNNNNITFYDGYFRIFKNSDLTKSTTLEITSTKKIVSVKVNYLYTTNEDGSVKYSNVGLNAIVDGVTTEGTEDTTVISEEFAVNAYSLILQGKKNNAKILSIEITYEDTAENDGYAESVVDQAVTADGHSVTFTAESAGTLTVTVGTCSPDWRMKVYGPNYESIRLSKWNGNPWTLEITEDMVGEWTVTVYAWSSALYDYTDGTVSFDVVFTPAEGEQEVEKVEYEVSDTALVLGDNTLTLLETAVTTIYAFEPTEVGVYTFTAPEGAILGYWGGGEFFLSDPASTTNTYEWTCTAVGQSAYIGVSGVEGEFVLNVAKTGDYEVITYTEVDYVNKVEPMYFELSNCMTLGDYVDVSVAHEAVLGTDGYYHLDSVDGPILLIDLDYQNIKLSDKLSSDIPYMYLYTEEKLEDGSYIKYVLNSAVLQYEAAMDASCYYPVTEDIILFYKDYATAQGLWSYNGVEGESAWMYCMRTMTIEHNYVDGTCTGCYDTVPTNTVYFQNNWLWSNVCFYYWGSEAYTNPDWPGLAATFSHNDGTYDWYVAEVPSDATGLIFNGTKNDGSGATDQTPDLTDWTDCMVYSMTWNGTNAVLTDVYHVEAYEDNYDGATHNKVCSVCDSVLEENVAHEYDENNTCVCGYVKAGTETNPILLLDMENTVENTGTVWYQGYFSGMIMSITGDGEFTVTYNGEELTYSYGFAEMEVASSNPRMPVVFAITGEGTYQVNFAYPEGHMMNPALLNTEYGGYNWANVSAGSQGYYYTWTAPADGTLTLDFSAMDTTTWADCGWTYVINNMTTYSYGETQWSDSDPVVNPATVTVAAGDEIQVIVNSYDPANMWANPEAQITVIAKFSCAEHVTGAYEDNWDGATHNHICSVCGETLEEGLAHELDENNTCVCGYVKEGTETNPIVIYGNYTATIAAGETVYFCACYQNGNSMTINGGEEVAISDYAYNFSITNDGEAEATYDIVFIQPAGTWNNPAELVLGDNVAPITDGSQGYYYTWTAPADGTLTLTISAETGWMYCVNNVTSYVYGDTQWSDSDPVVNPVVVTVAEGDVIEMMVNTYDPADMWNNPAGEVTVTAVFEAAASEELIKFLGTSTNLGNALTLDFMLDTAELNGTTGNYIVLTRTYNDGTENDVVTIPQSEWTLYGGTYYYVSYLNLAAKEIADEITAVVYNAEGEIISEPWTDSIATYAQRQLNKDSVAADEVLRTVYVDLLNYGAAAQTYFGYNTENLANANLTEEQASWATATVEVTNKSVYGTAYLGGSMTLVSEITLDMVFSVAYEDGMYAEVTFTDHYGDVVKQTLTPEDLSGVYTQVHVTGMAVADYQALVTCELYDAEGNLVGNAVDSMESYAARNAENLGEIVQAIVKLGASAYAYFHR